MTMQVSGTGQLRIVRDGLEIKLPDTTTRYATQELYVLAELTATTSEADIDLSSLTTPREFMLRNKDTTNSVQWGPKSGGAMVLLGQVAPGEAAGPFVLGGSVTISYKSTAGSPKLDVLVSAT